MKCYLHVKQNLKPSRSSREPTVSEIGDIIAKKLEDIWLKAFIPIMSRSRILQIFRDYNGKKRNILKSFKGLTV